MTLKDVLDICYGHQKIRIRMNDSTILYQGIKDVFLNEYANNPNIDIKYIYVDDPDDYLNITLK